MDYNLWKVIENYKEQSEEVTADNRTVLLFTAAKVKELNDKVDGITREMCNKVSKEDFKDRKTIIDKQMDERVSIKVCDLKHEAIENVSKKTIGIVSVIVAVGSLITAVVAMML